MPGRSPGLPDFLEENAQAHLFIQMNLEIQGTRQMVWVRHSNEVEQPSIPLELGSKSIDCRSTSSGCVDLPKPSGLGMVSTSRTSAARRPFGATW